jgi:hypothetical protein
MLLLGCGIHIEVVGQQTAKSSQSIRKTYAQQYFVTVVRVDAVSCVLHVSRLYSPRPDNSARRKTVLLRQGPHCKYPGSKPDRHTAANLSDSHRSAVLHCWFKTGIALSGYTQPQSTQKQCRWFTKSQVPLRHFDEPYHRSTCRWQHYVKNRITYQIPFLLSLALSHTKGIPSTTCAYTEWPAHNS